VTPTATLGGEVVRGSLLPSVPAPTAVASLVVDRLACAVADTGLGALGLVALLVRAELSGWTALAVLAAAALFVTGVGAFWRLQRNGRLLSGILDPLIRRFARRRAETEVSAAGREVDARIAAFHAERTSSLAAALGLHAAGSLVGAAQLGLFFHFVGAALGVVATLEVFLVALALDLFSFFVPGRLGAQEGARMFAFSLVGLDPALGLLFSLVLRIEQFVWAALGLALYFAFLASSPDEAALEDRGLCDTELGAAAPIAQATPLGDPLGGVEC